MPIIHPIPTCPPDISLVDIPSAFSRKTSAYRQMSCSFPHKLFNGSIIIPGAEEADIFCQAGPQ